MTDRDLKAVDNVESNDESNDVKHIPGDVSVEGQDLVKQSLPEVDWSQDEEVKAKRKYVVRDSLKNANLTILGWT